MSQTTTSLNELLASHPLAVEAIGLQSVHNRYTIATKVRDYANLNGVGDFAFDSIETLLDLIESKLRDERGLSDMEIHAMRWPEDAVVYTAYGPKTAYSHNSAIDALHREIKRLRKEKADAR